MSAKKFYAILIVAIWIIMVGAAVASTIADTKEAINNPLATLEDGKIVMTRDILNANSVHKVKDFKNKVDEGFGSGIGAPEITVDFGYFNDIQKDTVYVYDNDAIYIKNGAVIVSDIGFEPTVITKDGNKFVLQAQYPIFYIGKTPLLKCEFKENIEFSMVMNFFLSLIITAGYYIEKQREKLFTSTDS